MALSRSGSSGGEDGARRGVPLTGREVVLTPPLTEAQMRALHVGDIVLITGDMYTGRDNVHKHLMKNPPPWISTARRSTIAGR